MPEGLGVRVSAASPEADLAAVVWPGVSIVYYPRVESTNQVRVADTVLSRLERTRGIRPGTVELRPLIESAAGVSRVHRIAASSGRVRAIGAGPNLQFALEGDALAYARAECELSARALALEPLDFQFAPD